MNCPLCNRSDVAPMYTAGGYPIVRCSGCGLARVREIPAPETLNALYSDSYYKGGMDNLTYRDYEAERKALAKGFRRRLSRLKKYSPGGHLLDVGCALGFLLAEARDMGWTPFGVDRADYGIAWAKKNLGLENLHAGSIETAGFEDASFDAVTMMDVLEHLSDPVAEVKAIARVIKPSGVFMLDAWDIGSATAKFLGKSWPIMAPPDHLFFFDRTTVARLLGLAGFEVVEIFRMGRHMSVASLATKIPNGFPLKKAALGLTTKMSYPVPVNLHDNMIVIARRGETVDSRE